MIIMLNILKILFVISKKIFIIPKFYRYSTVEMEYISSTGFNDLTKKKS